MRTNEKEDLCDGIAALTGTLPDNTRYLLKVLSHPDLIKETRRYFEMMDADARCTSYEWPWTCIKEAEARYENIKYGWLGAASGAMGDWWCEPCRQKVIDT